MCGIAGILNLRDRPAPGKRELSAMIRTLAHRGPDGFGGYARGRVGLAHSRLSIIDLGGGRQPIHNEDGTIWVVYNGEIFNYLELRDELEAAGHRFATRTDTEVLVHLYERDGLDLVHRLNGQFAAALWDETRGRLVLLRDRVGILPLFYAEHDGRLLFGSEVKALLPVMGRPSQLDLAGLDDALTFWSPLPPRTLFPGVRQLLPGHVLVAEGASYRALRYWDFHFPDAEAASPLGPAEERERAEELRALLIDATRLRLRADVPVGAYLSGGLDSSALAALVANHSNAALRTFSIGFEDERLDETRYQKEMAERLRAEHARIRVRNADIGRGFGRMVWHAEQTVLRAAPVPMMLLSGLVRDQGYKVVLTGEGADEVLGGYDLFKETKVRRFWARHPESRLRPLLLRRLYPYLDLSPARARAYLEAFFGVGLDQPDHPLFSHLPRFATTAKCKELLSDAARASLAERPLDRLEAALPAALPRWHWLRRAQYVECRTLLSGYLLSAQGDRMLMASSVEGRFPFLDHRVIEHAAKVPPNLLVKVLSEKHLLKVAMQGEVPPSILNRPKQPYRAPGIPAFFDGGFPDDVRDLIAADTLRKFGYFDPQRVQHLVAKVERSGATSERDNMAFLGVLSTQWLHRRFVEEPPALPSNREDHGTEDPYVHFA